MNNMSNQIKNVKLGRVKNVKQKLNQIESIPQNIKLVWVKWKTCIITLKNVKLGKVKSNVTEVLKTK